MHPAVRVMDYPLVIGLVLVLVVAFFAFQWWSASKRPVKKTAAPAIAGMVGGAIAAGAAPLIEPLKEEVYPQVAGQTEGEMRTKEPTQRPVPVTHQQPASEDGKAPANFQDTLRRPEQSFHQPAATVPSLTVTDVPSGRASQMVAPANIAAQQQPFGPDMAQNGGALIGNSVFAYDGVEADTLTAF